MFEVLVLAHPCLKTEVWMAYSICIPMYIRTVHTYCTYVCVRRYIIGLGTGGVGGRGPYPPPPWLSSGEALPPPLEMYVHLHFQNNEKICYAT